MNVLAYPQNESDKSATTNYSESPNNALEVLTFSLLANDSNYTAICLKKLLNGNSRRMHSEHAGDDNLQQLDQDSDRNILR